MSQSKLFSCNIHGAIRVSSMAMCVVDTTEFQRLRELKQLGFCHHVYPSAVHTRFEHSIGVYHLTGIMSEVIMKKHPNMLFKVPELGGSIKLDARTCELMKIAALCHDIGHGPHSHGFDDGILADSKHPNRHHETRSCLIMEKVVRRVLPEIKTDEIAFMKSIISPGPEHTHCLYQVVANSHNGVDVDKFDYLARDSKQLGKQEFDCNRIIHEVDVDQNQNICFPKHCSSDIMELFQSRYMLYKRIYCHKTVKIIEVMMLEIYKIMDPILKISQSIEDMDKFCKLTDASVVNYVKAVMDAYIYVPDETLVSVKKANQILQRIQTRNLYKKIDELIDEPMSVVDDFFKRYPDLPRDTFVTITYKIGFVSGNKPNPFESIYFYDKAGDGKSFTKKIKEFSSLMSPKYQEDHILLVCKDLNLFQEAKQLWNTYRESI